MKELLVDTVNIRLAMTEADGGGKIIARGEFARGDVPTANKRVYPTKLWKREINRLGESMGGRKVFGELDHPEDGKTKLSRASHLVLNLKVNDDGVVIGEAEVMDTDAGRNLKAILDAGGTIGISSRGYGSVKLSEDGQHNVVQDDYNLLTFDFVADPAQGTAYPEFSAAEGVSKEANVNEATKTAQAVITEPGSQTAAQPIVAEGAQPLEVPVEPKVEPAAQPAPAPAEEATVTSMMPIGQHEDEVSALKKKFVADLAVAVDEQREKIREQVVSEIMTDPKFAGAHQAMESVKTLLRPFVMGTDVEAEIAKIRAEVEVEKKAKVDALANLESMQAERDEALSMCKDLGFNLFMERTLSKHPKYKEIVDSVDFDKVASLAELKKLVSPHVTELESLQVSAGKVVSESVVALQGEVATLKEEITGLKGKLKVAEDEKDLAMQIGMESASRAYLERKIVGNPSSSAIRKKFESLEEKTKKNVDLIVEAYTESASSKKGTLFESVRRGLRTPSEQPAGRTARSLPAVVETSLKGTVSRQSDAHRRLLHEPQGV